MGLSGPLVQINIPEGFLNPVEDKKVKTTKRGKEGKSLKDGAGPSRRHLFEARAKKWSDPHPHGCSVAKDVPKIFQ